MTLDRRLFDEACDSAVTQRMIAEMVKTRIIHRIVGDDVEAGMEVYGAQSGWGPRRGARGGRVND